jgi:hypothetical protein
LRVDPRIGHAWRRPTAMGRVTSADGKVVSGPFSSLEEAMR